ncbi:MAG: sirohydrochlorin cobaltochelatase [Eubacterium sp.]|nr:sirohydrochlorin cobaltochelatase [Eubacterium sp.]
MKKGFLVVSRGSVDEDIREKYLKELELIISERFEDTMIKAAYTDDKVRRELREKTGEKVPSVKAAMLSMSEEGVTELTVLSTHVVSGYDYRQMSEDISSCGTLFQRVRVARPLVEIEQDFDLASRAVHSVFKDKVEDGCLILMARGADDPDTEETMEKLEEAISARFEGRAYIATLNGSRGLTRVLMDMKKQGRSGKVVVVPFSFILGELRDHLCGGENSFEDRLMNQGYEPVIVEEGIGLYDAFLRLYLKHLYEA